jgi:tRNA(Ile)-lysidine synthase
VLRAAAKRMGFTLNFEQTARLMTMCEPEGPRKQELLAGLWAERSARELRLERKGASVGHDVAAPVEVAIPGEVSAFGVHLRISLAAAAEGAVAATLRTPKAGDRVKVRYSRGPKPLKEVFERMRVDPEARKTWPVLEWQGRIVWMKGIEMDPETEVPFAVETVLEV